MGKLGKSSLEEFTLDSVSSDTVSGKAGTTALSSVTSVEPEGLCLSSMSRRELRLLVHSGLEYIPSLAGAVGPSEDRTNNPLEPFPETHFSRSQEEIQVIHLDLLIIVTFLSGTWESQFGGASNSPW